MRIGLLLPPEPDHGWITRAAALAAVLIETPDWTVTIGLPDGPLWPTKAAWLYSPPRVSVRRMIWQSRAAAMLRQVFGAECVPDGLSDAAVPHDWGWTFRDCDAWVLCADARLGAVVGLRPMLVYCRGLDQRYIPTLLADSIDSPVWDHQVSAFLSWRQAAATVVTNPANATDVVSYAGVRREHLQVMPPLVGHITAEWPSNARHVAWLTGATVRYDHQCSARAFRRWRSGGAELPIAVGSLEGVVPSVLPDIQGMKTCPPELDPADAVHALMKNALLVFCDATADGEAEAALLAAATGRTYVGPDTPQARWVRDSLGASALLYPAGDVASAVAALDKAVALPQPRPVEFPSAAAAWRNAVSGLVTGSQ